MEAQLRSAKHREDAGLIDDAPRQVDEPATRRPAYQRSGEVDAVLRRRDRTLEFPSN
jgi:hypothetical protein